MSGRWNDEEDWRDRERRAGGQGWRGHPDDGRVDPRREARSWSSDDRVFGENESGLSYNRPQADRERLGRDAYDTGYRTARTETYPEPGYDDARRSALYRAQYGNREHYGDRDLERRYAGEMRRPASGGTGGYDYERGYGDAGREYTAEDRGWRPTYGSHDHRHDHDHRGAGEFEEKAREAGEMVRRAGQRIAGWFSGDGATQDERRQYEDFRGHRGVGPRGYKRSDERISDEVHQRLTDDAWLDASEISCSVSGGEVTLSGTVETREAKHRAERIVEDLAGVTHVQNNLRVRPGNPLTSAGRGYGDSVLEARMRQEPGEGSDPAAQDSAATRTTTRRT